MVVRSRVTLFCKEGRRGGSFFEEKLSLKDKYIPTRQRLYPTLPPLTKGRNYQPFFTVRPERVLVLSVMFLRIRVEVESQPRFLHRPANRPALGREVACE